MFHQKDDDLIDVEQEKFWIPKLDIIHILTIDSVVLGHQMQDLQYETKTGEMVVRRKLVVKIFCPMNLENYPFDTNSCPFKMRGDTADESDMKLQIRSDPTRKINGIKAFDTRIAKLDSDQELYVSSMNGRTFSVTGFKIEFSRRWKAIVMSIFLPSGLIVTISWIRYELVI